MHHQILTPIPPSRYQETLDVILDAFSERQDAGLNFGACAYTLEDIKRLVQDYISFAAITEDDEIHAVAFRKIISKGTDKHGYNYLLAVASKAKGQGVGTMLAEYTNKYMIEQGCRYVLADTSTEATSSVNFHIHRMGFHKIGLRSWPNTNYYSYLFRKDFQDRGWLVNNVIYPIQFLKSSIKCRLVFKADGSQRSLAKHIINIKKHLI